MLVLGTQVLISLQYESAFESAFGELPRTSQLLVVPALFLLLVTFGLLVWIPAYHRVVLNGDASHAFRRLATRVIIVALIPLAVALSIDVHIGAAKVGGLAVGIGAGIGTLLLAIFFWCGLGCACRWHFSRERTMQNQNPQEDVEHPPLHERVSEVLTEARVVLPGAQAMLGFQFITMLMHDFDRLPASSKSIHLICLGLIAATVVLLITPPAFHRIAESGEDSERVVRVSSRMVLAALVPLGLSMVGDLYVVVRKITDSLPLALGSAIAMFVFFFGLWFGYTWYRRWERGPGLTGSQMLGARPYADPP